MMLIREDRLAEFAARHADAAEAWAAAIRDLDIGRPDLTTRQRDYLAALTRFVADYEQEHAKATLARLSPLQVLKHLMEENKMDQTDLAQVLGSRGLASEVLNGR